MVGRDAHLLGDGPGRGRRVAGHHVRGHGEIAGQLAHRGRRVRLGLVAELDAAHGHAVDGHKRACSPRPVAGDLPDAHEHLAALHDTAHALADHGLEGGGRRQRHQAALGRIGHDGAGQGVLAFFLQGGGQAQGVIGNVAGHHGRLALGEGARLVENGRRQVAHGLQHRAVLDEHAELGALPHAHGERRGGR